MGADSWRKCPRCEDREKRQAGVHKETMDSLIDQLQQGELTHDEFKSELANISNKAEELTTSDREEFAEYYEFYLADGVVLADYHGECRDCGFKVSFQYEHEIKGIDE